MNLLSKMQRWLEILGGAQPPPSEMEIKPWFVILRGFWWVLLFSIAFAFMGAGTKFIYIDF